jgi:hypothetical protein
MKKRNQIALGALLFAFSAIPVKAQEDISSIFKAGIADIGTLANGYMKPAGNAFAASLGSNWYNTAATHSVLGFDLTFGASVSMVPTADQAFDLSTLSNLKPVNPSLTLPQHLEEKAMELNLHLKIIYQVCLAQILQLQLVFQDLFLLLIFN